MPTRRLALMRINRSTDSPLFSPVEQPFNEAITSALNPSISVTRYTRNWRLSRPQVIDDQASTFLWGKLGYQGSLPGNIEYDEIREDFVEVPGQQVGGQFSYFVVDLDGRYLLFEERSEIKLQSFRGALQKILQRSEEFPRFDVDPVIDPTDFITWLEQQDLVTKFRATVRQPNPNWTGRPQGMRAFFEATGADKATIEVTSDSSSGLKPLEPGLREFIEHVSEGNGTLSGNGQIDGRASSFDFARNVRSTKLNTEANEPEESFVRRLIAVLRGIV